MPFPHDGKKFKPGESGNPAGKPKGTKHLSTRIQEMLGDPKFTDKLRKIDGFSDADGATPMEVIVGAAMVAAAKGDGKARDWLGKFGYGHQIDITSNGETIKPALVEFIGGDGKDKNTNTN